jgi:hypothetical protein
MTFATDLAAIRSDLAVSGLTLAWKWQTVAVSGPPIQWSVWQDIQVLQSQVSRSQVYDQRARAQVLVDETLITVPADLTIKLGDRIQDDKGTVYRVKRITSTDLLSLALRVEDPIAGQRSDRDRVESAGSRMAP